MILIEDEIVLKIFNFFDFYEETNVYLNLIKMKKR